MGKRVYVVMILISLGISCIAQDSSIVEGALIDFSVSHFQTEKYKKEKPTRYYGKEPGWSIGINVLNPKLKYINYGLGMSIGEYSYKYITSSQYEYFGSLSRYNNNEQGEYTRIDIHGVVHLKLLKYLNIGGELGLAKNIGGNGSSYYRMSIIEDLYYVNEPAPPSTYWEYDREMFPYSKIFVGLKIPVDQFEFGLNYFNTIPYRKYYKSLIDKGVTFSIAYNADNLFTSKTGEGSGYIKSNFFRSNIGLVEDNIVFGLEKPIVYLFNDKLELGSNLNYFVGDYPSLHAFQSGGIFKYNLSKYFQPKANLGVSYMYDRNNLSFMFEAGIESQVFKRFGVGVYLWRDYYYYKGNFKYSLHYSF